MKLFSKNMAGELAWRPGFKSILVTLLFIATSFAQQYWAVNASMTFNTGQYIYQQRTDNYYLTTGLLYNDNNWSVSVSVPFILQNSGVYETTPSNQQQNMGKDLSQTTRNFYTGMGDVYLYGEYHIGAFSDPWPSLSLSAQSKIPTADHLTLFSTGAFDYGFGLIARKWFGTYSGFAEISYLRIGDPQEITYLDPVGYGLGLSKFFTSAPYSISVYFKGYTEIIPDLEPPRQLALGFFSFLSGKTIFSFYLIKGVSESSPDFALSSGIDWKF